MCYSSLMLRISCRHRVLPAQRGDVVVAPCCSRQGSPSPSSLPLSNIPSVEADLPCTNRRLMLGEAVQLTAKPHPLSLSLIAPS